MSTLQVLVIDDDVMTHDLIEIALKAIGIESHFATHADVGIQLAIDKQPNLILMDLLLPKSVKGWDVIAHIKGESALSHIPVVAFTAGTGHYIKQALEAGAEGFITKPFTIREFQKSIQHYLKIPYSR
ncbi:MAG: response regulator [Anaerolineae bacterium]